MITEAELPAATSRLDPDAMVAVAAEAGMIPLAEHEIPIAPHAA
jgi:Cu/Ag efflux pump CusA